MTRYRVPIREPLLATGRAWKAVEGLRFVSADGPWLRHPNVTICTFEDDNAPAGLEGQLVELVFRRDEDGTVSIIERSVVAS